ncbi:hypothetical protein BHAOGJBA_0606 [Methylobacterium hispanicum]|uniref:site-specific DNA-methyltransferase (adenine-specific) n=1 Tax=Methylobacterium hispanicum TaxID=270350 RepID=A0AAV4ZG71_9HYPH|nr:N-6 DNA methylase [Methylobacterium hispanicum]GJD87106.1 hypothetical protein BHAOGJBA_0606 [Methylobacterium hispanicum]
MSATAKPAGAAGATRAYSSLNARNELEQRVSEDLRRALAPRGASVTHYGTAASHAPASAPCDISVEYGTASTRRHLMVEVAQRPDASEFESIVSHLDAWVDTRGSRVNLLYSGRSTSARMARLIRNENERRASLKRAGRIVFIKLDDLQAYLARWAALPAAEVPATAIDAIFKRSDAFRDDSATAEVIRAALFPTWTEKAESLQKEAAQRLVLEQERLKKDIQSLENKLRERGVTGARSHKYLIYLFFMALFEDKRGMRTRATPAGFVTYKEGIPAADSLEPEFANHTVHHLMVKEILAHADVRAAGIHTQYERIELADEFVLRQVIPVFEKYSFSDASIDAIGAVFEALARRAEKDNRIGQFFTPETAVAATCRLAGIRPTDLVLDPACGTARFLIRAMAMMLARASEVTGATLATTNARIRERQLLGTDIDPWVSIIGKMNMYIHGDGKSNIRHANGLTLAARPIFAPQVAGPLVETIDVVATNPPLGDIDFAAVAEEVGNLIAGPDAPPEAVTAAARQWSSEAFDVVPHALREEGERDVARAKVEEYAIKVATLKAAGEEGKAARARQRLVEWQAKADAATSAIAAGRVTPVPAGRTAKGGALFISALVRVLKMSRDAGMPAEWQGGVLALVIDEAVLNTREYAAARGFIRRNFYLKAVVSLPRDAFEEMARTTAKTSILVLVRKEPGVVQREPVFFGQALRTGPSGGDLLRPNDLDVLCDAYDVWRNAILTACRADGTPVPTPDRIAEATETAQAVLAGLGDEASFGTWELDPERPQERLDVAHWRMKAVVSELPATIPLSDLADLVPTGRTPGQADFYSFAFVSWGSALVGLKPLTATRYATEELQQVEEGDVLVSGIDLINGAVGVVGSDCEGAVVSKEYYILRTKPGVDPHWLVAMLRTPLVRRIIEGMVTGTSKRTRFESGDTLLALQVPPMPPPDVQKASGDLLREAHKHQRLVTFEVTEASRLALGEEPAPDAD